MTSTISLTAAEVALLLREAGAEGAPVSAVLGISDEEHGETVTAAALSSLLLRGLAVTIGGRLRFGDALAAVAEGLADPLYWVEIGLVAWDTANGAVLVEGPGERFLVTPRGHRCFDLTGIDRAVPVEDPVAEVVRSFLTRFQPASASLRVTVPGLATPFPWVTVSGAGHAGWTVATAGGAAAGLSEEDALRRLRAAFTDLVPVVER
jgi:hypothetical protein